MHVFEMVVLIVLIGGIVSIINNFVGGKSGRKKDLSDMLGLSEDGMGFDGLGGNGKQYADIERLEQLEERVAVLEKIVTDSSYDLNKEFEKL